MGYKGLSDADIDAMSDLKAIKAFFLRKDAISPNGGKELPIAQMRGLGNIKAEMGQLAREELKNPTVETFE